MALPLPPAFRKALSTTVTASSSASDDANPMGVSESESDAPAQKGDKPNPLKAWASSKLAAT